MSVNKTLASNTIVKQMFGMAEEDAYAAEIESIVLQMRLELNKYPIRFLELLTGINRSTVNRFINGDDPKLSTVIKIANIMDDSIEDKYRAWKNKEWLNTMGEG